MKSELNPVEQQISYQLSEMLRYTVRASISQDYYRYNERFATETLKQLVRLFHAISEDESYTKIIREVVDDLIPSNDEYEQKVGLMTVAEVGTIFLMEMSSTDNAARGRQSKQRDSLINAIQLYSELSERRRSKP